MPARAARISADARLRFWRVLIVSAFFTIVLSANLFVGAVVVFGGMRDQVNDDPRRIKTATITQPMLDGKFCRTTVFDNNSALSLADRVERCDQAGSKLKTGRKTDFTWGGK